MDRKAKLANKLVGGNVKASFLVRHSVVNDSCRISDSV